MTLPAQVAKIKEALGLDTSLAIAPALQEANKVMGLPPEGGGSEAEGGGASLPAQAATILEQLGL